MAKSLKHVAVHVKTFIRMFSKPEIYIPKKLTKIGRKVVDIKYPWQVYFYYRNPITNKMIKHIYKAELINSTQFLIEH